MGYTQLPYYLTAGGEQRTDTASLTKFWTAAGPPPVPLAPTRRAAT